MRMNKNDMYCVVINDGLFGGGKVFSYKGLVELFKEELKISVFRDSEGNEYEFKDGIEELISCGENGCKMELVNNELLEMGDDYCGLSICKLEVE